MQEWSSSGGLMVVMMMMILCEVVGGVGRQG